MNNVLVKHNDSKPFAFYVPDEMLGLIKKGQGVLCKTIRGLTYGETITGVISGDGAMDIALSHGAYIPLKPIVGFEHPAFVNSPAIRRAMTSEFLEKAERAFAQA